MGGTKFSWVKTHKEITRYLSTKENSQKELIDLLKSIGITGFNDKLEADGINIELSEIDPFSFFCYIYKYGNKNRLKYLQKLAKIIDASVPSDEKGIPSAQAQKVWLFPYKYDRVNDEIKRLWSFFHKALDKELTDIDFEDIMRINGVGSTKLTEALFYIDPSNYLPINRPVKEYLLKTYSLKAAFDSYTQYIELLNKVKKSSKDTFYEISYFAWEDLEKTKSNDLISKFDYSKQLKSFIDQAKTKNLKTKHYINTYRNNKVKVSFGQGNSAKIPWISFLKDPFTTSNGIYPVYLLYKEINKLILAYGISETNTPKIKWNLKKTNSIVEYFQKNSLGNPQRYGSSYVFRIYDVNNLPSDEQLNNDLDQIIDQYANIKNKLSFQEKNITNMAFDLSVLQKNCEASGLQYSTQLITRYIASLATKPFVLLSGLSGSGKTKLAQSFAQWICENQDQYCIVPVGADWTNREPLLGYVNALDPKEYVLPENRALELIIRANDDKEKPYFLILDEMNLSHVERYFADFLSVMESNDTFKLHSSDKNLNTTDGEKHYESIEVPNKIRWPKNLFVVGTVNIDETTYMFSPKVLDRANVIEFRVREDDLEAYFNSDIKFDMNKLHLNDDKNSAGKGANMGVDFVEKAKGSSKTDTKNLEKDLKRFFVKLQKVGAEFGYRTASEIQRLYGQIDTVNTTLTIEELKPHKYKSIDNFKIDIAIMQKLLPKLHGSRNKLADVLKALAVLCYEENTKLTEVVIKDILEKENDATVLYPISLEKIQRMYANVIQNGFTSYAEA